MEFDFRETYKTYSKEELFEIVLNAEQYQHDAITAAIEIIKERNWDLEMNKKIAAQKLLELKNTAEATKLKSIIEDGCYIEISGHEIIAADSILTDHNIDYCFLEKSNIKRPGRFYYFHRKDFEEAKKLLSWS